MKVGDRHRTYTIFIFCWVLALFLCVRGGLAEAADQAASRWSVMRESGVYWLCTPGGQRFYSRGVNTVKGGVLSVKTQRRQAFFWRNHFTELPQWRKSTRKNLDAWGFNTRGAWSDPSPDFVLPLMVELDLGRHAKLLWFDPFDPAASDAVRRWAKKLTAPYRDDPQLIGYFTDNEVGWWNAPLFRWYLEQGWENHTKRVLWQLLYEHYQGNWKKLLVDWVPQEGQHSFDELKPADVHLKMRPGGAGIRLVDRFTYLCARRYYELVYGALREAHPAALILGDRLPLYYQQDAVRAMTGLVDVVSTNYNVDVPNGWVAPYYFHGLQQLIEKPVLVTEFFFAANENRSGNLNPGHLMTVQTQAERARGVQTAIANFARFPNVVGAHWFQYADEPTGGREDGENYNMGLVDIANRPYEQLTEVFRQFNPQLESIHGDTIVQGGPALTGSGMLIEVLLWRSTAPISVTDHSLLDWDLAQTRLPDFHTAKPYVPFADVHLAWTPQGLYLACLASNYVDWGLLEYQQRFPLAETFQLHLLVEGQDHRSHHYAIHLFPEQSLRFPDRLEVKPQLYRYDNGQPVESLPAEGFVQKLKKPLPHIAFEAFIPARWLGFARLQGGTRLRMNIALINFYREHRMLWTSATRFLNDAQPVQWQNVVLRDDSPRLACR